MDFEQIKNYEVSFLLTPDLSDEEILLKIQQIRNSITSNSGMVGKEESTKKIKLAYPVQKQSHAYFGNMFFSSSPNSISGIKNEFKTEKSIIRFLITAVSKKQEKEAKRIEEKLKAKIPSKEKTKDKEQVESPKTPGAKKPEEKTKIGMEDLDKKLEEILGE